MRVEGGYTFPARIERVYDALTRAEGLERALPRCERLIQLGPAGADGAAAFEARLRAGERAVTLRITIVAARRPAHARFDLDIASAAGRLRGKGLFDLVDQDAHTVGAYVLDLRPATVGQTAAGAPERAQAFVQQFCDDLAARLLAAQGGPEAAAAVPTAGVATRTPRGRIVALAPALAAAEARTPTIRWTQRAAWMGAGLLLGMGALALVAEVARRFGEHGDD